MLSNARPADKLKNRHRHVTIIVELLEKRLYPYNYKVLKKYIVCFRRIVFIDILSPHMKLKFIHLKLYTHV